MRRATLLAGLGATLGLLAGAAAAAPGARAAWDCDAAAAAAARPADHPLAGAAERIFLRMADLARALTGRAVEVRVLPYGGFPASAVTCPRAAGADARVYVTSELLDLVQDKPYPYDFLAFVLGHELGHRLIDLDQDGAPRPSGLSGADVEKRADARGAFLAAAAGYTLHKLACDDLLDVYLDEYKGKPGGGVSEAARRDRQRQLLDVLEHLEGWEALFQAGTALALSGEPADAAAARELLQWAGRAMEAQGLVVPELQIMRALALITEVAPRASPLRNAGLPGDVTWLRCEPVFPGQTRLASAARGTRGALSAADQAALREAVALLEEAGRQGGGELVVASGLACGLWYLGERDEADARLAAAERAARAGRAPEAVLATLAANRALFAFARAVGDAPAPAPADAGAAKAWARELQRRAADFAASPGVASVVKALARYPATGPGDLAPPAAPAALADCKPVAGAPDEGPVRLPAVPDTRPAELGCPCGWAPLHALEAPGEGAVPGRAVVCVPLGWARGTRLVRFAPPRARASVADVLLVDRPDGALRDVATWTAACGAGLQPRGTTDDGARAFAAACHALGLDRGLLFTDQCRVERAIVLP